MYLSLHITHYTPYITHHVVGEQGASDAANKQTSDTLHFHPKFSWTEERRGEEMRGEEKEFVIDHKKTKKRREKKKPRKKNPGAASEQAMSDV